MEGTGQHFPPPTPASDFSNPTSPVESYRDGLTPRHGSPVHIDSNSMHPSQQQQQQQQQQPQPQQQPPPPPPEPRPHSHPSYPGASVYTPTEAPSERLNPRSCVTCRRRKVRCDKHMPCSNCRRAQIPCIFPAPGRAPRRPRPKDPNAPPKLPSSEREIELIKRLRKLEGIVEELSGQIEVDTARGNHSSDGNSPETNANPGSDPHSQAAGGGGLRHDRADSIAANSSHSQGSPGMQSAEGRPSPYSYNSGSGVLQRQDSVNNKFGRLVVNDHGKTRYVSSGLCSMITDELNEIRKETHRLTDGESDLSDAESIMTTTNYGGGGDHHAFLLGYRSADVDLRPLHPLPSQIPYMWQVYKENVDPIVKVLHVPTVEKLVNQTRKDLDNLTPANEALMFAIYLAAITSMEQHDVKTNFGVERPKLITQYRFALEQALAKAEFVISPELVVLQAFILFLVLVRRPDDTRFCWTLTGLAIRIGQSMGLHRDGKFLPGLTPLEIEMRRRLFWALCMLDLRWAEDQGTELTIVEGTFDTELPLNINDSDISEDSTELPLSRQGASDMTFSLIRYEICAQARTLYVVSGARPTAACPRDAAISLEERESMVRSIYEGVEEKYFNDQRTSCEPMLWTAANIARVITAKMTLVIYQPMLFPGSNGEVLSEEIRERIFTASTDIFEYNHQLNSDPRSRPWKWLFQTYTQWHAVAYSLMEMIHRGWGPSVERAWVALNSIFTRPHPDDFNRILGDQSVWLPLRKIYLKAKKYREAEIARLRANPDAAQQLELEERNKAPAPLSFTVLPGCVKNAVAMTRWRTVVNAPPLPPHFHKQPSNPIVLQTQRAAVHQDSVTPPPPTTNMDAGSNGGGATRTVGDPHSVAMNAVQDTMGSSVFTPENLWPMAFAPEYEDIARGTLSTTGGFPPFMGIGTGDIPRQDATPASFVNNGGGARRSSQSPPNGAAPAANTDSRMQATPLLDALKVEGNVPVWMWSDSSVGSPSIFNGGSVTAVPGSNGGGATPSGSISANTPTSRQAFQFPLGEPGMVGGNGVLTEDIDMDMNEDFNWADWGQSLMEQGGNTGGVWSAHGI